MGAGAGRGLGWPPEEHVREKPQGWWLWFLVVTAVSSNYPWDSGYVPPALMRRTDA